MSCWCLVAVKLKLLLIIHDSIIILICNLQWVPAKWVRQDLHRRSLALLIPAVQLRFFQCVLSAWLCKFVAAECSWFPLCTLFPVTLPVSLSQLPVTGQLISALVSFWGLVTSGAECYTVCDWAKTLLYIVIKRDCSQCKLCRSDEHLFVWPPWEVCALGPTLAETAFTQSGS